MVVLVLLPSDVPMDADLLAATSEREQQLQKQVSLLKRQLHTAQQEMADKRFDWFQSVDMSCT